MSICLCDGRYAGCDHGKSCTRIAGGQWSPHFCVDCDERRMVHIDKRFDEIEQKMRDEVRRKG